ncbi:hypothetical protein VTN02DRAFT_4128 [Thermoascus thermophilus]
MLAGTSIRGSGAAAGLARQRLTASLRSSRLISSVASQSPRIQARLARNAPVLAGNLSWKPASSVSRSISARFNSTSSASAAAATTASNDAAERAPQADTTNVSDLSDLDITQIPEKIGYLKELGLDFGWGPSSIIEWTIEHIHIWSGLPWWASIVGTGLLLRLALLKPMMDASDTSAKIQNLKPLSTPLRASMMYYAREGNNTEVMKIRAQLQDLHIQHGVKPWKAFVPMLQIPFGYGCFRVVRGMSSLPVPGLAGESVGWLKDLTVADPYFILPAATAAFMYLSFRKGGEAGMNEFQNTTFGKVFLYGLPSMSFLFMAFFPSSLQLYFVTTGLFALGQSYLLNNDNFRKFAGLAIRDRDLPPSGSPQAGPSASPLNPRLRMIYDTIEAEQRKAAAAAAAAAEAEAQSKQNISLIDRTLNNAKDSFENLKREATEKVQKLAGQGPVINPDGTPAPPPRLSQKDLKIAAEYDKRRKEEEDWKREERNHARREAHLRALEAEREKAARSWLKNRQVKQK